MTSLLHETRAFIKKKKRMRFYRSFAPTIQHVQGTNRLPRYRVFIPSGAQDLLVGMILAGKYYVLSILGYGGMSVVYKGRTVSKGITSSKARMVAVKTLRVQGLSDERTVKRFQREAELLSHLNHPRIVQVAHYGTTSRGQPYFVMDYLTGINLADLLKNQVCLPPHRVKDIFSQVCGAVDHAHRCGVIHRDLKPGNIMLMDHDEPGDMVKVVDFGIARFEEEAQRLTKLGEVWGSPIYMSPEQCTGAQLDVRSDIYSIGICMYEALTGKVPYLGKNYVETMSLQIMAEPKRFADLCPEKNIPSSLERVVRKTLEKEPDHRYQTMAELRADLEESLSGGESAKPRRSSSSRLPISLPGMGPSKTGSSAKSPRLTSSQAPKAVAPAKQTSGEDDRTRVSRTDVPAPSGVRNSLIDMPIGVLPPGMDTLQELKAPPTNLPMPQNDIVKPQAISGTNTAAQRGMNARVSKNRMPGQNRKKKGAGASGGTLGSIAKISIALAVIAVILVASDIVGNYITRHPEWANMFKTENQGNSQDSNSPNNEPEGRSDGQGDKPPSSE
jgi:serine/threonine protein kinase